MLVAARLPEVSRSQAQRLIRAGLVRVDGRVRAQGFRPAPGSVIEVTLPEPPRPSSPLAEPGDLEILYEDDRILAIAKRPGDVVHPGAGHRSGTVVNRLLASGRALSSIGGPERAGLVHRLDRETSGVLVIAKDDEAHAALARQFKDRTIRKAYLALVLGAGTPDRWRVQTAYGRRSADRRQFTGRVREGREAVTEFFTLLRGALCAWILAHPRTGRTHQIRVHLAEGGHPIVADRVYGRGYPRTRAETAETQALRRLNRTALHAWGLRFRHPGSGDPITLIAPVPEDLREVLRAIFGDEGLAVLSRDPFQSP